MQLHLRRDTSGTTYFHVSPRFLRNIAARALRRGQPAVAADYRRLASHIVRTGRATASVHIAAETPTLTIAGKPFPFAAVLDLERRLELRHARYPRGFEDVVFTPTAEQVRNVATWTREPERSLLLDLAATVEHHPGEPLRLRLRVGKRPAPSMLSLLMLSTETPPLPRPWRCMSA